MSSRIVVIFTRDTEKIQDNLGDDVVVSDAMFIHFDKTIIIAFIFGVMMAAIETGQFRLLIHTIITVACILCTLVASNCVVRRYLHREMMIDARPFVFFNADDATCDELQALAALLERRFEIIEVD